MCLVTGNLLYTKIVDRSFPIMFAINTSLMTMATVYSFICLKWQTRPEQQSLREAGVRNPFTDFFDINNIKQTMVTLTKRRTNYRRLFLWFFLISMALYTFQRGEYTVITILVVDIFMDYHVILMKIVLSIPIIYMW